MPRLSDTQTILLSTAAQRDGGSVLPLPDRLARGGTRVARALEGLANRRLIAEQETDAADTVHREEGDFRYGLFVTPAGLAAIGVVAEGPDEPVAPAAASPAPPSPAPTTKSAAVLALLQRAEGATLPELIAATGWLPHTTRAALTGLRRKGHAVVRDKRDGATCYRIVAA